MQASALSGFASIAFEPEFHPVAALPLAQFHRDHRRSQRSTREWSFSQAAGRCLIGNDQLLGEQLPSVLCHLIGPIVTAAGVPGVVDVELSFVGKNFLVIGIDLLPGRVNRVERLLRTDAGWACVKVSAISASTAGGTCSFKTAGHMQRQQDAVAASMRASSFSATIPRIRGSVVLVAAT